jgi:hypothetical protein
LELTLHLSRLEGRAGAGAQGGGEAAKAEPPAAQEMRGRLLKDLSGRFKKL